jgi:DNA polymerase elongation subunit (family B)
MSYISAWRNRDSIVVWERTVEGRIVKQYPAPYYFYIENEDGKFRSIFGKNLSRIKFKTHDEFKEAVQECLDDDIPVYESDIPPDLKVLAKHYYEVEPPKLNTTLLDIEVDYDPLIGFSSITNPYAPINAIALHHYWKNESVVYAVPPPNWDPSTFDESLRKLSKIVICKNERELLQHMLREFHDSDCLSGWNSDFFDLPYICKRIELVLGKLELDKMSFPNCGKNTVRWREVEKFGKISHTVELRGRIKLDYMELFKKYEMDKRANYKLETIAEEILPDLKKLSYDGSLAQLYRNDFNHFLRYNIRDTEILKGFEDKLGYIDLANVMYHSACGLASHVFGTVRLADLSIINYCHNVIGVKVPDWVAKEDGSIEGAIVLLPQVGMHDWTGSVDIGSLYPSAIRSINISPETLVAQFAGKMDAWSAIARGLDTELLLEYNDGSVETHTADEWRTIIHDNKWAVSGYGTVFRQDKQGVVPALLTDWFSTRKKYQKLKVEWGDKYRELEKTGHKDTPEYQEAKTKTSYYDRLQYVYKIKLNSTYGALTNYRFRFFDLRTGESTTATGRQILFHQVRKIAETLDGKYDVDFPQYTTTKDCDEKGMPHHLALHGPKFNGQFQTESVIYGDTDSCYFLTHASNEADAIKMADYVADVVNKSFQEFMQRSFMCHPGYDNLIKAGREVVSDRGIFVDKKRYVLHVVNMDGKPEDKLKVMGLEMRKTTTPKVIQNFLKDIVSRILRGEDWDEINDQIIDYRDHVVTNMDLLDIGLPKGCNKMEEYALKKAAGRDSTGKKYTIPGHVSAALHYNEALKIYGDKESPEIQSEMKVKVFYLDKPINGFKSIALPTDLDRPPDWFVQHFNINRGDHAQRLIDNNLGHIFKAIGKEVPTRQTLLFNSLYGFE